MCVLCCVLLMKILTAGRPDFCIQFTDGASRGRRSASRVMLPNYRVSAIIATMTSSAGGEAAVSQPAQQNPLWRLLPIRLIPDWPGQIDRRLVTGLRFSSRQNSQRAAACLIPEPLTGRLTRPPEGGIYMAMLV
jgi:hypothetical protein